MQKQTSRRYQSFFLTAISLAVLGGIPTLASAGEDSSDRQATTLNTVTVTAQKTEEDVQEVPVSVSVLDDSTLEDYQIENLQDVYNYIPNVYQPSNEGAPSIRGIRADMTTQSVSSGLYVDGVPTSTGVGFMALMNGVERVEVLRGPQGTLYGKNTLAGVVNVITKKPGNEREGNVYAEIGEDNKYEVGGFFNAPVIEDKFYVGFTGRFYQKDGLIENTYLDNTADDREDFYGKLYLRLTPTDRLDISLISSFMEPDNGGFSQNSTSAANLFEVEYDVDEYVNLPKETHALNLSYQFDNFTLNSVTSYQKTTMEAFRDMDYTSAPLGYMKIDMPYETWAEELRVNGEEGKLKWLVGFYADKFEKSGGFDVIFSGNTFGNYTDINENTIGIFGHVDYRFTDRLSATFGLRYDNDHKENDDHSNGKYEEADYSAISPKFALQYKINERVETYVTVAKGYKSGGFYMFAAPGYPSKYDQETLWSYEIGVKSFLMDSRLMLNAAAYYIDHSDMQVLTILDGGGLGYVSNAASATSMGIELESNFIINKNLSVFANLGLNDSKFDEFSDAVGVYDDNDKPYAPHYSYAVGLKYRGFGGFYASADLTGYGKSYLDNANKSELHAYELVNAKIGYEWEHIDFYIYGKNILDKEYNQAQGSMVSFSDPRELGVRLIYRF